MKLGQKLAVNYLRARLNLQAVFSPRRAAEKAFEIFITPHYRSRKPASPLFQQALPQHITVKGIRINGYKFNSGGDKRILVLHGFESTVRNFDGIVQALIKKNYEVLAFDAPAHGNSGGRQITLPLYVDMIEMIYYKYGGLQGAVAHSFGGMAVSLFAEKLPAGSDLRLALIAPLTATCVATDSFFRFLQLGKPVRAEFEKILEEKGGHPSEWYSLSRIFTNLRPEVLFVQDKQDDITTYADAQTLLDGRYPRVQALVTEGLGHKQVYRDQKVIRAVAEFL